MIYDCENYGSLFWVLDKKNVWRYWFQDSFVDPKNETQMETVCVGLYQNDMNIFSYNGSHDVDHSITGGPITETLETTVKVVNKTSVEFKNLFD